MGALYVVLVAVELGRDIRPKPVAVAALVAISGLTLIGNLSALAKGDDFLSGAATGTRANLAALEIVRGSVAADAEALIGVRAGPYLDAVDAYGSPANSIGELPGLAESTRGGVDTTFAKLIPLSPVATERRSAGGVCRREAVAPPLELELAVPPRALVLEARGEVTLALRRYATASFPVALGPLPAGVPASLAIGPDRSRVPWVLQASGEGSLLVCEPAGEPG